MAKQTGIISFSGRLGEMVGYNRNGKHYSKVTGKTYRQSEESIKSSREFGNANKAAALIRSAFVPVLFPSFNDKLFHRLLKAVSGVIQSGTLAKKGSRTVYDGDIQLLKGFELSMHTKLNKLVRAVPHIIMNAKELSIQFADVHWDEHISAPQNADCLVLRVACGCFDFNTSTYSFAESAELRIDRNMTLKHAKMTLPMMNAKEFAALTAVTAYFENKGIRIDDRRHQAGALTAAAHWRKGKQVKFSGGTAKPANTHKTDEFKNTIAWDTEYE